MVRFHDDWDLRLWHHPTAQDLCRNNPVPRTQIKDQGESGLRYHPLTGTVREVTDDGATGDPVPVHDAAKRLGVSDEQMQAWLDRNNAALRQPYEGTD